MKAIFMPSADTIHRRFNPFRVKFSLRKCIALAGLFAFAGVGAQPSLAGLVTGNIDPLTIEIDPSANLYPSGAVGFVDWVKDSAANSDTPSLIDSVATGLIPNVTAAPNGKGHWYGVR